MIADSIASITGSEPSSIGVRCAVNVSIRCRRRCVRLQRGSSFGRFGSGETGQSLKEVIGNPSHSGQATGRRSGHGRSSTRRGRRSTRTTLYRGLLQPFLGRNETSYQLGRKARGSGGAGHSLGLLSEREAEKRVGVRLKPAIALKETYAGGNAESLPLWGDVRQSLHGKRHKGWAGEPAPFYCSTRPPVMPYMKLGKAAVSPEARNAA